MNDTLYTCLIEEQDAQEPFVQVYWARASHLGEAIQAMLDAARKNGLQNPKAQQCDPYEISNLNGNVVPSPDADVFWAPNRHFFPPEPTFDLPVGIIASCIEGEYDVDEISCGFTVEANNDGLTTIEANVEASQLFPVYGRILRLFKSYKVFWYILHGHWDHESEDIHLVNEGLSTPEKILGHLSDNWVNSILNGYVTLTAFLEEGATNINISDHKRLIILTYSTAVAEACRKTLEQSGCPEQADLVHIDREMHHWHYRLPHSKSRVELEQLLKGLGFSIWKPKARS